MGTHPIFESDFDCLTECQSVVDQHNGVFSQEVGIFSIVRDSHSKRLQKLQFKHYQEGRKWCLVPTLVIILSFITHGELHWREICGKNICIISNLIGLKR